MSSHTALDMSSIISDSDDDSSSSYHTPIKRTRPLTSASLELSKTKHRNQKFRDDWLKLPDFKYWLAYVHGDQRKAKCTVCNKQMVSELTVLKNHMKTKNHMANIKTVKSTSRSTLQKFVQTQSISSKVDIQVKEAEIKICSYFAEHNIPFHTMDHLEQVLKSAFPDSEIAKQMSLKRTKCSTVICSVIGAYEKQELVKVLCSSKFSILTDESTDISTNKCICIVVRFFDQKIKKVASSFFELVSALDQEDSNSTLSAEHLFQKIINVFKSNNIPLTNIIGFGSDGCNVMMGEYNSVASRFKELCPGIIISKCICHSLHLCASQACKELPRNCEDLARNVYNFFKMSSKRLHELKQFQVFAETNIHRILHPSQTRWLSLSCVVTRILEQWPALVLFFNEKWLSEKLIATEQIYNSLNNPYIKLYYQFLDWALPKFSAMNAFFQSEKVLIVTMHEKLEGHYRELLLCYMKSDYVNSRETSEIDPCNETYFIHKPSMYLGVAVNRNLQNSINLKQQPELLEDFYTKCQNFLKTACCEIRKRYDFKYSVFKEMTFLVPKNALSLKFRDKYPSLQHFITRFNIFTTEVEWQAIDDQWRYLPLYYQTTNAVQFTTDMDIEIDHFWADQLLLKNDGGEALFYNLSVFALNILSVPHSNAQCERVFSKINLIKTKCRNKLITPTVNGTLLAAQNIINNGSCKEFMPPKELVQKMNKNMYSFKTEKGNMTESEGNVLELEFTYDE